MQIRLTWINTRRRKIIAIIIDFQKVLKLSVNSKMIFIREKKHILFEICLIKIYLINNSINISYDKN